MPISLLAVMPKNTNYNPIYKVTVARSFEEAKVLIEKAEGQGNRFDDLDLPVDDYKSFTDFLDWMEETDRKYAFSIFGNITDAQFASIAQMARERGFHFNS